NAAAENRGDDFGFSIEKRQPAGHREERQSNGENDQLEFASAHHITTLCNRCGIHELPHVGRSWVSLRHASVSGHLETSHDRFMRGTPQRISASLVWFCQEHSVASDD